jgi:hypothetical protein
MFDSKTEEGEKTEVFLSRALKYGGIDILWFE